METCKFGRSNCFSPVVRKKKIKLRRPLSNKAQLDSLLPQESSQGTAVTFILKISDSM